MYEIIVPLYSHISKEEAEELAEELEQVFALSIPPIVREVKSK